jgi:predicted amidohydrolase YtcJ
MTSTYLYHNATIHTMDLEQPNAEALLLSGDRILAVGGREQLEGAAPAGTERVDLHGAVVLPGFNDSHGHILWLGMSLDQINLSADRIGSVDELVALVSGRARDVAPGNWVLGSGYDQNMLRERRHPTREDLDRAAPEHPVLLRHTSGHVLTCNTRALDLAGITGTTDDPQGGEIDRDEHGLPTGVMKESAMDLVSVHVPPPTLEEGGRAIVRATVELSRYGITSVSDAATGQVPQAEPAFEMYLRAFDSGELAARVQIMPHIHYVTSPDGTSARPPAELALRSDPDWLQVGPVKIFSDGALSTRTAAMTVPYHGDSDNVGILMWPQEQLIGMIDRAHAAGWQIATHALGDRAVMAVVDAYERAITRTPRSDHRHRIEHCMVADDNLVRRIARLGIVLSLQPDIFRLGDGYVRAMGLERAADTIPLQRFRRLGATFSFSSDFPVIPPNPLPIIRSSIQRVTPSGIHLGSEHASTVGEAVRKYTVGGSFTTRTDDHRGVLSAGRLADFVVLSGDPFRLPLDEWDGIRVLSTIVGGHTTYSAE